MRQARLVLKEQLVLPVHKDHKELQALLDNRAKRVTLCRRDTYYFCSMDRYMDDINWFFAMGGYSWNFPIMFNV